MQQANIQIGGRIKRLRRHKKVSQTALAEALGIFASYLNLLEHNRRRVTVALLFKAASYFGVDPGELAESEEPRLAGDLMEIFGDELFVDCDLTNQDIADLATSNPAVGRAVTRLYDRYRQLGRAARHSRRRPMQAGLSPRMLSRISCRRMPIIFRPWKKRPTVSAPISTRRPNLLSTACAATSTTSSACNGGSRRCPRA